MGKLELNAVERKALDGRERGGRGDPVRLGGKDGGLGKGSLRGGRSGHVSSGVVVWEQGDAGAGRDGSLGTKVHGGEDHGVEVHGGNRDLAGAGVEGLHQRAGTVGDARLWRRAVGGGDATRLRRVLAGSLGWEWRLGMRLRKLPGVVEGCRKKTYLLLTVVKKLGVLGHQRRAAMSGAVEQRGAGAGDGGRSSGRADGAGELGDGGGDSRHGDDGDEYVMSLCVFGLWLQAWLKLSCFC